MDVETHKARDNCDPAPSPAQEFAGYTTLHGLHFIVDGRFILRRLVWAALLLVGLAFLGRQLYISYNKLHSNESIWGKELQYDEKLKFPAFTLCNLNMMKKSKLLNTDAQTYLDQFGLIRRLLNKTSRVNMSAGFDIEKAVLDKGHSIKDTVAGCLWGGKVCTADNFTTTFSFKYGLCHTFNSGQEGHPILWADRSGEYGGLMLTLTVQPDEYYGIFSYLGTGIRFLVHEQDEFPFTETYGMDTMPGFTSSIRFRRQKIFSLPKPFKSACGGDRLETFDSYSQSRCLLECYTRKAIAQCGCRILSMPGTGAFSGTKYCTPEQIITCGAGQSSGSILQSARNSSTNSANQMASLPSSLLSGELLRFTPSMCDCPIKCETVQYQTTVTTAYLPSTPFMDLILETNGYPPNVDRQTRSLLTAEVRRSMAVLNVFFEDMSTDTSRERAAYDINDFGSDVGGNLGLFLGCSLLTLFEFIDLIIMAFTNRYTRASKPQGDQTAQGFNRNTCDNPPQATHNGTALENSDERAETTGSKMTKF